MPTAAIHHSRIRENATLHRSVQDHHASQPTQFRVTLALHFIIYAGDR
jgi:hypothetical protein